MDISAIQPNSRVVEIKHPGTGEGLKIFVTLVSQDDAQVRPVRRQLNDRVLQQRQRGKAVIASELEHNAVVLIRASIVEWDWSKSEMTWKGKKPDCNKETVTEVLTELVWFRDQLDEALSDDRAFFQT